MKSGAGDDPFADDLSKEDDGQTDRSNSDTRPTSIAQEPTNSSSMSESNTTESVTELPYKYRRNSVKEGRTQQPMFLQDETEALIEGTVNEIESQFDEDVYKTDVVEAMIVAGGEDATPEAVLRRWGYGMKNS